MCYINDSCTNRNQNNEFEWLYESIDLIVIHVIFKKKLSSTQQSSNPAHDEVYSIYFYVIKFVTNLRQVGIYSEYAGFLHH